MRIRKMLPVLCMALGLTMAAPLAAGATAEDVSGTTTNTQTANETGWHYNADGSRSYTIDGKTVTGFQWIANSQGTKLLYYFNPENGLLLQSKSAGRIKIGNDYYYTFGPNGNYAIASAQGWIRTEGNSRAYYVSGPSNNGKLLANRVAKIGRFYYGFNSYGQRWAKEGRRRLGTKVYYVTSSGFLRTNKWQNIKLSAIRETFFVDGLESRRPSDTHCSTSILESGNLLIVSITKDTRRSTFCNLYKEFRCFNSSWIKEVKTC